MGGGAVVVGGGVAATVVVATVVEVVVEEMAGMAKAEAAKAVAAVVAMERKEVEAEMLATAPSRQTALARELGSTSYSHASADTPRRRTMRVVQSVLAKPPALNSFPAGSLGAT